MAFPVVESTATTERTAAETTSPVNYPATVSANAMLFAFGRVAVAGAFGWPAGWNSLGESDSDGSDDVTVAAWKIAAGTEDGLTFDVTHGNGKSAYIVYSITGATDSPAPVLGGGAVGTSTTPDPGSFAPSGGAKDYLWLWLGGWEGEQTSPPVGNPTNYTNPLGASTGTAAAVASNCRVASAQRNLNAASEDPPSWTISVSDDWTAFVTAIHPGAVAIVLDAASGSYAVSGVAATTLHNYLLDAASGSYSISGVAATTSHGIILLADPGSYALSGSAATTLFNRILDAVSGVYSLSGQAATLARGLFMDAVSGVYAISGQAASTLKGYFLDAVSGLYSIIGAEATALWTRLLDATFGTYVISGVAAEISKGQLLSADPGTYSLSGQAATLLTAKSFNAEPGSYAITGAAATTATGRLLSADPGAYVITGVAAELVYTPVGAIVINAESGSYSITGAPASFIAPTPTPAPSVGDGAYTPPGGWARLLATIRNPLPDRWWERFRTERRQIEEEEEVRRVGLTLSYSGLAEQSSVQAPVVAVSQPVSDAAQPSSSISTPVTVLPLSISAPAAIPSASIQPPLIVLPLPPVVVWSDKQYRDDLDDLVALGVIDPDDRDRELLELIGRQ